MRILVADDEPTVRYTLSRLLERRGHQVVVAEDAQEALRLAGEGEFDAALVDARMPGDGVELFRRLEQLPGLQGRAVLMSGDVERDRASIEAEFGARFLKKPFKYDAMVGLIEGLAGQAAAGGEQG
ncbi:MAG: response regulator [Gemmatimonadetes bacterium]|nr:response regulator [Gemmatimonadota bacterium]